MECLQVLLHLDVAEDTTLVILVSFHAGDYTGSFRDIDDEDDEAVVDGEDPFEVKNVRGRSVQL